MKRIYGFSLSILLVMSIILAGCAGNKNDASGNSDTSGKSDTSGEKVELTLYSTMLDDKEREVYQEIISNFEAETGISVDVNFPGDKYEDQLRVKMAANDLPDLFDTHGWAINRYGEYTADLKDMDWVEHLDEALNPILKDDSGKIHALPLNQAKDGIMYNATLLEEYGIEAPATVDEWIQAMEQVKEKSGGEVDPLWIPGNNHYAFARILDRLSTPLLVTDDAHNFSESLLDGTFDWSNYTLLPETLLKIKEQGLMNSDALTANDAQLVDLMAQNKVAFVFVAGASLGPAVTEINPDIRVGAMPVPAFWEGDDPSWIGGERHTVAAYKDSKHLEEAKQFIAYVAKPENLQKLANATQLPPGLTNVTADNYYNEFFEQWKHVQVQPYFDRIYLPGGMFDVYATTGQELIAGISTPEQVSKVMGDEYKRLREQNK